jgi:hypothetical protein
VFFVHCDRCHRTLRAGALEGNDIDVESRSELEAFHAEHASCSLRLFEPTGRAMASGPWHEPSSERWFEVRDRLGLAVAIGTRTSVEEPIDWRIENLAFDEEIEIALDRELFWDDVERALHPHKVPKRQIAAWANRVDNYLRTVASSDCVVLYDDTRRPEQSAGCLTLTARTPLEASLRTFGFDAEIAEQLLSLFNDVEFPPLRITRRVTTSSKARRTRHYAPARLDSPDPLV